MPARKAVAARDRLIVALDVATASDARALVARLGNSVSFYKVGLELVYAGGLDLVDALVDAGKHVFLDLKLHDIPNTVEAAARAVAKRGATFLTIHGYPQTMRAAKAGVAGSATKLLAVTVMTSMDDGDLLEAGYDQGVSALVGRRAEQSSRLGIDGLIVSPNEVAGLRQGAARDLLLITPGVRPAGSPRGDQKRVMTPSEAIAAGADYLVVGRPVTRAADPVAAAHTIVAEIEGAQK